LRRLVQQLGLGQDAAADRHHGIGGQDVGALELLVDAYQRKRGPPSRAPAGLAQARGSSPRCGVSSMSVGRSESGSIPAWFDQLHAAGRTGCEHELRTSDHARSLPRIVDDLRRHLGNGIDVY